MSVKCHLRPVHTTGFTAGVHAISSTCNIQRCIASTTIIKYKYKYSALKCKYKYNYYTLNYY